MYKILDEPQPSKWNHLAVNPIWPLFGAMFGGAWLSFTWYAFNGYALGCPNRLKTLFLAIGGFLGALVFTLLIFYLLTIEVVTKANIPYLLLLLLCWKLGVSYYLYIQQSRTFHIYEHFGNTVKNGVFVVIGGAVFGDKLILNLFDGPLWSLVVG